MTKRILPLSMCRLKQARFWTYHRGLVRIKIDKGQTLHHSHGGATDEGYHWEWDRYFFDGKTVFHEIDTDSRDCDGRYDYHGESRCDVDDLNKGATEEVINGGGEVIEIYHFPEWRHGKESQRDYSAEAAGY
jgi:hypothetical protein